MISTLIAAPYKLARLPLAIVDNTLSDKLPETSGTRLALNRVIGSVDKVAGTVLRNPEIAQRGTDRIERSTLVVLGLDEADETGTDREAEVATIASDERATVPTDTVQEHKVGGELAVEAIKQVAQRKATSELENAEELQQSAAETKAEADHFSDLAETTEHERHDH